MIRMQEFVKSITRYANKFKNQYSNLSFPRLSLELNKPTSKFMCTVYSSFGSVDEFKSPSLRKRTVSVPDITFPVSSSRALPASLSSGPQQGSSAVSLFSVSAAKSSSIVSSTYRSPLAASTTAHFASNSTATNMLLSRMDGSSIV